MNREIFALGIFGLKNVNVEQFLRASSYSQETVVYKSSMTGISSEINFVVLQDHKKYFSDQNFLIYNTSTHFPFPLPSPSLSRQVLLGLKVHKQEEVESAHVTSLNKNALTVS